MTGLLPVRGSLAAAILGGRLPDVHGEHDNLGRHGAHLVGEAVPVDAVHVRRERVLAVALPLPLVDDLGKIKIKSLIQKCSPTSTYYIQYVVSSSYLPVGSFDAHVDVKESSLRHLEHEPHLGAHLHLVEEALLRVGVHLGKDKKNDKVLVTEQRALVARQKGGLN